VNDATGAWSGVTAMPLKFVPDSIGPGVAVATLIGVTRPPVQSVT